MRLNTSAGRDGAQARDPAPARLSRGEEITLARQARDGNKAARDRLIEANLPLSVWVARKYVGRARPLQLEDLIQEGHMGLTIAADRFDPDAHDVRFGTYAYWWVKNRILRAIQDQRDLIRVPSHHHAAGTFERVCARFSAIPIDALSRSVREDGLAPDALCDLIARIPGADQRLLLQYAADRAEVPSADSRAARRRRAAHARKLIQQLRQELSRARKGI